MTTEAHSQLTNQNGSGLTINFNLKLHVEKVEAQTLNLLGDLQKLFPPAFIPNDSPTAFSPPVPEEPLTDVAASYLDIIPNDMRPIYDTLDKKMQLVCLALLRLQTVEENGEKLFKNFNDWWGTYSPLVYDEGLCDNPGTFYNIMLQIGMGHFNVNCTKSQMTSINGVFMKKLCDWRVEDYLDGYGSRDWAFWHKKKIAQTLTEILKELHMELRY